MPPIPWLSANLFPSKSVESYSPKEPGYETKQHCIDVRGDF